MTERNYTNPEDRGRFGFSMSGTYRAPFKYENFFVTLLTAAAAGIAVALVFILRGMYDKVKLDEKSAPFLVLVSCGLALIISVILIVFIFGVGIKSVKKGYLCKYSANEACFTANVGGDLHVIYYSDVVSVDFTSRMAFGKIRGYDVVVKLNNYEEHLSICSDGYLSQQSTPFYIIQERIELQRNSYSEKKNQEPVGAIGFDEIQSARQNRQTTSDVMQELSAQPTDEMSAVNIQKPPPKKPAPPPSQTMQSIGIEQATAIDNWGRETRRNDAQAQGVFYLSPKTSTMVIVAALTIIVGGFLGMLLIEVFWYLVYFMNGVEKKIINIAFGALSAVFLTIHFLARQRGKMCSYRADAIGFYVTIKGKGSEQIIYKDVLSVDYTPTKFLWFVRGYKVEILTTYGIVTYNYIFPRFGHAIPKKDLPFEVIRLNIAEKTS